MLKNNLYKYKYVNIDNEHSLLSFVLLGLFNISFSKNEICYLC